MLIGYKDDENDTHTSTRTSSIDIQPSSENVTRLVLRLVLAIGKEEMSVKSMMEAVGLKNRLNFMDYSLTPAIREGFVCMEYPANPPSSPSTLFADDKRFDVVGRKYWLSTQ